MRFLKERKYELYLKLQFENKMERELRSEIRESKFLFGFTNLTLNVGDTAETLVMDLVTKGLLSMKDKNQVQTSIATELERLF